jgi:PmbA protein
MQPADLALLVVKEGRRGGADDVAATCVREDVKMIRFSNNQVTVSQAWHSCITNVMVAVRKRVGIGSIEDLSRGSVKHSLAELLKLTNASKPNKDYARLPQGPFKYTPSQANLGSIKSSDLVAYVKATISSAISNGADRVAGALILRKIDTEIETSAAVSGHDSLSSLEISVRAFSNNEASGQANSCSRIEKDFRPEQAGQAAAEVAKKAISPVEGKPGTYDVILGPNVVASLMNEVMSAASAFNIDAGLSFMTNMLKKRVASDNLTLIDDGTVPDGVNSRAFDDEGIPTRRTTVIEKGILKSFLHNSLTAKKFNSSTTGNAGWILPQPWNIIVNGNQLSEEKLFQSLDKGIYITNNWYTRFQNYRTGDFSTVCRDGLFMIRHGQAIQSLKGLRISDSLPRILRKIAGVSNKQYWIKWWEVEVPTLAPHMLVTDINLTKSVS